MDGSADAVSSGNGASDTGAADGPLDSANDSDVGDLGAERAEASDAAPAEKSKPKADAKKPDQQAAADQKAIEHFERVSGLRIHKEDVPRLKQLITGAYGAFEKAAKLERLLQPQNREQLFQALKIDADSFAAERLSKRLEERLLSPEEKAQKDRETAFEEREKKLSEREKKADAAELTDLEKREVARIDRDWTDALKKSGLPARRENLVRMAQIAKDYLAKKHVELPVEHIAEIVREEREALRGETLKADIADADETRFDAFMKAIPAAGQKRMRDWFIAQVRRPSGATKPQQQAETAPAKRREKPSLTPEQFRERMGL